ncbi:hypothetical protein BJ138DRAFT_1147444 [Hygrophoropsis aurantiaca]|uniref:Uncharacterized protein n=1 Tax=Hygrophoropsis aurantiaca TaxID=72124 RepID=A0ACB8AHE2_9AGAM|nr:hypothetical protein BJ138DRAFT_1147444 [Hygrophoropsis aurantiaca]
MLAGPCYLTSCLMTSGEHRVLFAPQPELRTISRHPGLSSRFKLVRHPLTLPCRAMQDMLWNIINLAILFSTLTAANACAYEAHDDQWHLTFYQMGECGYNDTMKPTEFHGKIAAGNPGRSCTGCRAIPSSLHGKFDAFTFRGARTPTLRSKKAADLWDEYWELYFWERDCSHNVYADNGPQIVPWTTRRQRSAKYFQVCNSN